ncbi:17465_t:CDS:1, partial [Funneliformis geosporum]
STIGKNGFHISQRVSEFNKTVCHYAEQTFAKLKKTAAYSAKFNEKAKNKCHE